MSHEVPDSSAVRVAPDTAIPLDELRFTFQTSGGPGGQNVNRVQTRVTLHFDVETSPSLSEEQKYRVRRRLANRINTEGILKVIASRHRTQAANRRAAVHRFEELMSSALRVQKARRKTRVPRAARHRRRKEKQQRSELKGQRRWRPGRGE